MFMRETAGITVEELVEQVGDNAETSVTDFSRLSVDMTEERVIEWRDSQGATRQVPISEEGLHHLAAHLDVPFKFLERQDPEFRQMIVNGLIQRNHGEFCVRWNDSGVKGFHGLHQELFTPRQVARVGSNVIPAADVVNLTHTPKLFTFDLVVPVDHEGWGGDRKVGDLTGAGLRFGLNVERNLAPWVQPWSYRLACTNGMEFFDPELRLDARGKTVEEVMDDLEDAAARAFGRVEHQIEAFYAMRSERVSNPERTLLRLATERGISERVATGMMRRIPEMELEEVTMFDLLNLLTNEANNPAISVAHARQLQQAGGGVVSDHAARCAHCQSKLN